MKSNPIIRRAFQHALTPGASRLWLSAIVLTLAGQMFAQTGTPTRPEAAAPCTVCHGEDGNSVDLQSPNIAGQNSLYLATQLKKYRDGSRPSEIMAPLAGTLSDQDIESLSAWYSLQKVKPAPLADEDLVEHGRNRIAYCMACHGFTGQTANSEWPNLTGQRAAYIVQQLNAFKSGKRINASMTAILNTLNDKDIRAVAAYYSQTDQ
jgi:cytochrome c553